MLFGFEWVCSRGVSSGRFLCGCILLFGVFARILSLVWHEIVVFRLLGEFCLVGLFRDGCGWVFMGSVLGWFLQV